MISILKMIFHRYTLVEQLNLILDKNILASIVLKMMLAKGKV